LQIAKELGDISEDGVKYQHIIAKNARLALEEKTGRKVVTGENFFPPKKENKKLK